MDPIKIMPCLDMKNGRVVKGGAQILLAASVFHYRLLSIRQVKEYLRDKGLAVLL
jgi:cyclase